MSIKSNNFYLKIQEYSLSEMVDHTIQNGLQDGRITAIAGGSLALLTSGIGLVLSGRSKEQSSMHRIAHAGSLMTGGIGASFIVTNLLRFFSPDVIEPFLDPDLSSACTYPGSIAGCKPDCIFGPSPIRLNYPCNPGYHSSLSPVMNARAHEAELLIESKRTNETTDMVLDELALKIYRAKPWTRAIIPIAYKERATEFAKQIYSRFLDRYRPYGINEENAVMWIDPKEFQGGYSYHITKDWVEKFGMARQAIVGRGAFEIENGFSLPEGLIAVHELMHIEDGGASGELFTVMQDLLNLDQIYKQINNIDLNSEVDYGRHIQIKRPEFSDFEGFEGSDWKQVKYICENKMPLGKFINFYRDLQQKTSNWGKTMTSEESIGFLTACEKSERRS